MLNLLTPTAWEPQRVCELLVNGGTLRTGIDQEHCRSAVNLAVKNQGTSQGGTGWWYPIAQSQGKQNAQEKNKRAQHSA